MTTYTEIEKIDRGDNVCIFGVPRIHVTQPTEGSTAGFSGMTDIPYCYYFTVTVVPGGTAWFSTRHLDRGLGHVRDLSKAWIMTPSISFNNLKP